MHAQLLSHVWLFVSLRTVAHQAPLSKGFPKQEDWSGLCFLLQGLFATQGWNPRLLSLAGGFFTAESPREAPFSKRSV